MIAKKKTLLTNGDKNPVKHGQLVGSKKKGHWYDEYYDLFIFKVKPIPYAYLERLAEDLVAWSKLDTSLRIESFYDDKGIGEDDYYRFLKRCEPLKHSHDLAIRRIAVRRDLGAMTRKYDGSWIAKTQSYFDKVYREARKFEADLTKDAQDNQAKIVVMEIMPNSTEVKDKKEDE